MSQEFNPADEDDHGECRYEIDRLTRLLIRLRVCCSKALSAYDGAYAQTGMATWTGADVDEMRLAVAETGCEGWANPCPISFRHQPHDYCDGKPAAPKLAQNKRDWRIGLSCKPRLRTHERYYEPPGKIIAVHPSGEGGLTDQNGILRIQQGNITFLARAEDWIKS